LRNERIGSYCLIMCHGNDASAQHLSLSLRIIPGHGVRSTRAAYPRPYAAFRMRRKKFRTATTSIHGLRTSAHIPCGTPVVAQS
jgi:hypothetical protein